MHCNRRQFAKTSLLAGVACTGLANVIIAAGSTTHVVQRGETLSRISNSYGVTVSALRNANNISGDLIRVGQKLTIPNTSGSGGTPLITTYHVVSRADGGRRRIWQRFHI